MSCRIVVLYLLRVVILLLSFGTLGCHVAQLILLGQESDTGSWWPDFIPYILYYVGPIVSILSVVILLILGCVQSKSLLNDRIMSIINLLLFIGIVVYNSLESDTIPWTGALINQFNSTSRGWAGYCSNYTDNIISIRCWLVNGTWLGMIVVGFFWLILSLYTIVTRNSDIYNEDYDTYDYKDDAPMSQKRREENSSSIIANGGPLPPSAYTSPTIPQHHYNNMSSPAIIDNNSNNNNNNGYYYYHQQQHQPQMYDNNNTDYYLNHVQDEGHLQYTPQTHYAVDNGGGYERSRKLSKTFVEDISPPFNNESVQPPHSYNSHYN